VRANMVAHPGQYAWSSYRSNAQGDPSSLLTPHPLYSALGAHDGQRQAVYRELFRPHLDPGLVDEIRRATNGSYALGSPRFQEQVAAALGRRASRGQSGRPRKRQRQGIGGMKTVVCPLFPAGCASLDFHAAELT